MVANLYLKVQRLMDADILFSYKLFMLKFNNIFYKSNYNRADSEIFKILVGRISRLFFHNQITLRDISEISAQINEN